MRVSRNAQSSKFDEPLLNNSYRNITGYGHKIVPILRKYASVTLTKQMSIIWDGQYAVPTAHLLTTMLFGFSFNIAGFEDIFDEKR